MRSVGHAIIAIGLAVATAAAAQQSKCSVSSAQYQALQTGMSYSQAVKVLGCPGEEMVRNEMAGFTTVMYAWSGGFGANMNAMFQNDKLVQKAPFGLK